MASSLVFKPERPNSRVTVSYSLNGFINAALVVGIQNIFSSMTDLARDLIGTFDLNLHEPGSISRVSATLHLAYYQVCITLIFIIFENAYFHLHQCTILATRPIVFTLVQRQLTPNDTFSHGRLVSDPVVAILKTCVGAASTIIRILSVLHDQGLIGKSVIKSLP